MRILALTCAFFVFAAGAAAQEAPPPAPEVVPAEEEAEAPPPAPEAEAEVSPEAEGAAELPEEAEAAEVPEVEAVGEAEAGEAEAVEAAAPKEPAPPTAVEAKVVRRPFRPLARELRSTLEKGLQPGESIVLSVDKVRGDREVVSLVTRSITLQFLFTPDGLFQVLKLSGQEGGRASFELVAGVKSLSWHLIVGKGAGRLRCWPVSGFTAAAGQSGLSLKLECSSWAFALMAEDVGPDGLEISAEGLTGVLHDGQRLDSRRAEEGQVVFVVSGRPWPREYTPWEMAGIKWEDGPRPAGEPRQAAYSPLRSWQTLFLPTIELEVLRPEDVSP